MSGFFHLRHCHLNDGKRFFLYFLIVSNDSELQQLEMNSLIDNSQWKLMLGKEFKGLWLLRVGLSKSSSVHGEKLSSWRLSRQGKEMSQHNQRFRLWNWKLLDKVWCWVHYCIWWLCMANSNHQARVRNNLSHSRKSASVKYICVQIPSAHLHPDFKTI